MQLANLIQKIRTPVSNTHLEILPDLIIAVSEMGDRLDIRKVIATEIALQLQGLKAELKAALKSELKAELKSELRAELKADLKLEAGSGAAAASSKSPNDVFDVQRVSSGELSKVSRGLICEELMPVVYDKVMARINTEIMPQVQKMAAHIDYRTTDGEEILSSYQGQIAQRTLESRGLLTQGGKMAKGQIGSHVHQLWDDDEDHM